MHIRILYLANLKVQKYVKNMPRFLKKEKSVYLAQNSHSLRFLLKEMRNQMPNSGATPQ